MWRKRVTEYIGDKDDGTAPVSLGLLEIGTVWKKQLLRTLEIKFFQAASLAFPVYPRVYPRVWSFSKSCQIPVRPSPVTPWSTVQLANYPTLLLILHMCPTIEIQYNSLAVHLYKRQNVLLFNNTASQLSKCSYVKLSDCQATSGLFCFNPSKNYYRVSILTGTPKNSQYNIPFYPLAVSEQLT